MLQHLKDAGLYINIKKYNFLVKEVKYFRLIISTDGVYMDPKKIYIITEWQAPGRIKDVQAFFSFINSSLSPITTPILLIKKLGGGIQFYINYRGLNVITIKN